MASAAGHPPSYSVYPLSSVALYNGVTLAHYGLGAAGMILGYERWPVFAWILGLAYLTFALVQMYVVMPLTVCPSCVYRRMPGARCASAMNLVSALVTAPRDTEDFRRRASGALCHNNLYLTALVVPLALMVAALIIGFSWLVLALFFAVGVLFGLRMAVLFPRVACVHCAARGQCPNAQAMGLS